MIFTRGGILRSAELCKLTSNEGEGEGVEEGKGESFNGARREGKNESFETMGVNHRGKKKENLNRIEERGRC